MCEFQDRCLAVVDLDQKSDENLAFLDFYEKYFIPRNFQGMLKNENCHKSGNFFQKSFLKFNHKCQLIIFQLKSSKL